MESNELELDEDADYILTPNSAKHDPSLYDSNVGNDSLQYAADEAEPTPEDLAVDESLAPLEKLDFYSQSDLVLHRYTLLIRFIKTLRG
jgi:hypothetical protein